MINYMNQPLISIIVPVYNTEPYLKRCIDSILRQTYINLEIILVDDGSTDASGSICDEYKQQDPRIVVIHQSNKGVSAARNAALDIASGEYISFVDSDDWIDFNMIKVLYDCINKNQADISIANFYSSDTDSIVKRNNVKIYNKEKALCALMASNEIHGVVWAKLFEKKLFQDTEFCEDIFVSEDTLALATLISKANVITLTEYKGYHYIQREDSAIHSYNERYWTALEANDRIYCIYNKVLPENIDIVQANILRFIVVFAVPLADTKQLSKDNYRRLKEHAEKYNNYNARKLLSKKHKILLNIFILSRFIFLVTRNIWNNVKAK